MQLLAMLLFEPMFWKLLTGTGYMRSTNKAIAALKATFQTPVYPLLDQVRSGLGAKIDHELAHLKVSSQSRLQCAVLNCMLMPIA